MAYNLKKSIIQWESVCICICLHPQRGSLSAQCVVLINRYRDQTKAVHSLQLASASFSFFSPFYIIKALNGKLAILGDFFQHG